MSDLWLEPDPGLQASPQIEASASADRQPADIRRAAMDLLARREHSRLELTRKLRKRFRDQALIEEQLDRLAEEQLQSDTRYAESFLRQRAGKGYGPLRVRQEMGQRGLSDGEISQAFDSLAIDWHSLAEEVFRKKFGDPLEVSARGEEDLREKARCLRFMQYRGFCSEHYRHLVGD